MGLVRSEILCLLGGSFGGFHVSEDDADFIIGDGFAKGFEDGGEAATFQIFRGFLESQTALDFVASRSKLERLKIVDIRNFSEDAGANLLTLSIVLPDGELAKRLLTLHLDALELIGEEI